MPEAYRGARAHLRHPRAPLPRHAGHGVHRRARQALDAADPQRQAHRQARRCASRSSWRTKALITQDEAVEPGRSGGARPAAASDHRSRRPSATCSPPACRPRPARRRGEIVFSSDEAEAAKQGRPQGHPGARRDLARGHPRHARRRGHPDDARRHDLPCGGGRARHGQALRLRRGHRSASTTRAQTLTRRAARTCKKGDVITIDGSTGQVLAGRVPMLQPELSGEFATLMDWADAARRMKVRANADTPLDAAHRAGRSAPRASGCAGPSTCSSRATASSRCAR